MTELEEAKAAVKKWQKKVDKHRRAGLDASEKHDRASSFLRDAQSRVRRLEVPDQPRAGSVIRFVKWFTGRTTVFVYVATRAPNGWYCTGYGAPQQATWETLVAYIRKDSVAPFGFEILTSQTTSLSSGLSPF